MDSSRRRAPTTERSSFAFEDQALPKLQQAYAIEPQFLTNHVGYFILVTGLLVQLAEDGRVVMLSSAAHGRDPARPPSGERGYHPSVAYGQSKLANLLFANELARRFTGTRRTANAVHPGVIRTALGGICLPSATSPWAWPGRSC